MLTDYLGNFASPLAINGLVSTTKDFTQDINLRVASGAVDPQNHPLNPDLGESDLALEITTEDGITGNGANLLINVLNDDDVAFGSATTIDTITLGDPGAGGFAAGTNFGTFKLPKGVDEQYIRIQAEEDAATAIGAGATVSVRLIRFPV